MLCCRDNRVAVFCIYLCRKFLESSHSPLHGKRNGNYRHGIRSTEMRLTIRGCECSVLNRDGRWYVPLPQVLHTHPGDHRHDEDDHAGR